MNGNLIVLCKIPYQYCITAGLVCQRIHTAVKGWRIYEVTCDDPGVSKPAFLSTKQTVAPVQEQVDALDDYIDYFSI